MSIDAKTEALIRLRSTMEEAKMIVVFLGFNMGDFMDAVLEEKNVEVLRDVLVLLPLQDVSNIEDGRETNDSVQRVVQARIKVLEADGASP